MKDEMNEDKSITQGTKTAKASIPKEKGIQVVDGVDGVTPEMTRSQVMAEVLTRQVIAPTTFLAYANLHDDTANKIDINDVTDSLRRAGDEIVRGDMGRVERMLLTQAITMDNMFNTLAYRASKHENLKYMDSFMRLALKAQAQCRATAEALALLKNPQPYIRQANIAQGPQQVNNTYSKASDHTTIRNMPTESVKQALENQSSPMLEGVSEQYVGAHMRAGAGNHETVPNKLMGDV